MSLIALSKIQKIYLLVSFSVIALALMAPIASNVYLPKNADFDFHLGGIVQARMALEEGQFPIRVAPLEHQGLRYPHFQFYSPLPYSIAAIIYKIENETFVNADNLFIVYKTTIWLALILAGIYAFRLSYWLTKSKQIAFLASTLYLCSPYLMINLNVRGDFTETIAQCFVPVVIFYSLKLAFERTSSFFAIPATLSWFALLTTHIITFAYTACFLSYLLLFLYFDKQIKFQKIIIFFGAILSSCMLAAWYIAPILTVLSSLNINHDFWNPYYYNWLTPISNLLSLRATPPMPLPGKGNLQTALYFAFGWINILAFAVLSYGQMTKNYRPKSPYACLITPLLLLYIIAAFAVWSPINFWQYLPQFLVIEQYPYRMLTQTMWIGNVLFAMAMLSVFKHVDLPQTILGLMIIVFASSSWLIAGESGLTSAQIYAHPDLSYAKFDYLINDQLFPKSQKSYLSPDACRQQGSETLCEIKLKQAKQIKLPILYYPKLLNIEVNHKPVAYFPVPQSHRLVYTGIHVPPGLSQIKIQFRGLSWANKISLFSWLILLTLSFWLGKRLIK